MTNIKTLIRNMISESISKQSSMTDMYRHIANYHHHMRAAEDAHNMGHEKKRDNHIKHADTHLNNLYKKHGEYLPPKENFHHYNHDDHESASEFVHYAHPKGVNFHETEKNGKKWT
jgi:hypothetical protein